MPSRRPHSKSRHGCVQCKRAHVKCDQLHPTCSNCMRSTKRCEFVIVPSSQHVAAAYASPAPYTSSLSDNASPRETGPQGFVYQPQPLAFNPPPTPDFGFQDLGLMHNYACIAYRSVVTHQVTEKIWRSMVPNLALSEEYLMHGLLALSALQMDATQPIGSNRYLAAASRHRERALSKIAPLLVEIKPENCNAIVAFSILTGVLGFAFPQSPNAPKPLDPVGEIVDVFKLMRGVTTVLGSCYEYVLASEFEPMLRRAFLFNPVEPLISTSILLDRLEKRNEDSSDDQATKDGYLEAIDRLRICFRNAEIMPGDPGMVLDWPATLKAPYMALVADRKPMALAILIHFAALLHSLEDTWWLRGWGKQLGEAITAVLGDEWKDLTQGPSRMIELGPMMWGENVRAAQESRSREGAEVELRFS